MDCGIVVEAEPGRRRAHCAPMHRVRKGQLVVMGHRGVRVAPLERPRERELFQFMSSAVSSEKPKRVVIRNIAGRLLACREKGEKVLLVGGPAIIHTGAGPILERIIRRELVQVLFAGNALATHDIEAAMFGTSLGVALERGSPVRHGHQNHLRAINRIRRLGGIAQAVEKGVLTRGVMHACIQEKVEVVLAGSIRDDGPLPDVITDTLEAQETMRRHLPGVGIALLLATTLHSVAVGNMLPARVMTVCVDISAATVTKLIDRGTFQAVGLVMDAESFLRELETCLGPEGCPI
jgi:lysine-ketoglutarate reductase/saccharopine dehydrogenase-like protein (TIGR00300 family)